MNVLICYNPGDAKAAAYGERRAKAGDSVAFCPDSAPAGADVDEVVFPADWPTLQTDRAGWIAEGVTVTVLGGDAPPKPAEAEPAVETEGE